MGYLQESQVCSMRKELCLRSSTRHRLLLRFLCFLRMSKGMALRTQWCDHICVLGCFQQQGQSSIKLAGLRFLNRVDRDHQRLDYHLIKTYTSDFEYSYLLLLLRKQPFGVGPQNNFHEQLLAMGRYPNL